MIPQRILVTGGAGFIGCNFVRLLIAETGARVCVLDKLTYAGHLQNLADLMDHPRLRFVEGDICDRALVDGLLADWQPTVLINFAAESHVDRSIDGPGAFVQTNIVGVFTLLEACRAYLSTRSRDAKDFRFVQVSTDEVFGSLGPAGAFAETSPYDPRSPYAASKASADHLVRAYFHTYDMPVLLTNCSNNYGPYQFPEKLIPLIILNALDGKSLPIYGDGRQVRDWVHVEDHVRAILRVVEKGLPGESYNIGAENERRNIEVVDQVCALLDELVVDVDRAALGAAGHTSFAALKTFVADRPGHDRRYAIDAGKMRDQLNWTPRLGFDQGLRQTVVWYLQHRDWCRQVQHNNYERQRLGLDGEGHTS